MEIRPKHIGSRRQDCQWLLERLAIVMEGERSRVTDRRYLPRDLATLGKLTGYFIKAHLYVDNGLPPADLGI